jgi:hypothetical protein
MANLSDVARFILGVVCGLALATWIALYTHGELGVAVHSTGIATLTGLRNLVMPVSHLLHNSAESWPNSLFIRDESKKPPLEAFSSPEITLARATPHVVGFGSKSARQKGLLSPYTHSVPLEKLSPPQGHAVLEGKTTPVVSFGQRLAAFAPLTWMGLGVKAEDPHNWGKILLKPGMILVMVLTFVGAAWGLKAAVAHAENSGEHVNGQHEESASAVCQRSTKVPSEEDIIKAFDAVDKRMGFIDRATVNEFLGHHMTHPGHLDAADAFLGNAKKLFFDDFRRLAAQPGPFADAVMERLHKPWERIAKSSPEIMSITQETLPTTSLTQLQDCTDTICKDVCGGKRSWDKLRAELAPKSHQLDQAHMRPDYDESISASQAGAQDNVDHFSLFDGEPAKDVDDDLDWYESSFFPMGLPGEMEAKMTFAEQVKSEYDRRRRRHSV